MISKMDIEIYSEIFWEKSITEKYLGYVSFNWEYSSVKYIADCTIAIPFDLFDKVIVGILSVDEVLSIEQVGEILGMNLIYNPASLQYKDDAEYDILRIAIDNLKDYNMIEIGDTSYSSCKLTKDGKLFAAKGYKFRVDENKPFRLYFDHTTGNHKQAKRELETAKGKQLQLNTEFNFLDESLIPSIAEVQVPEIHNPKLGNSFINPQIDNRNSASFILKMAVSLLFDLETRQTRFIAFEPNSKKTNPFFTDFLNKNRQDTLSLFERDVEEGILIESNSPYVNGLIQDKAKIISLVNTEPRDALVLSKKSNIESEFIDQEYFWINLNDFISKDTEEIFLLIPEPTEFLISKIKQLAEDNESPSLFIVFRQPAEESLNKGIQQLQQFSNSIDNKLFVTSYKEVNSFECLFKWKKGITILDESSLDFRNEDSHFSKVFYRKKRSSLLELPEHYSKIKKSFAAEYLKIIEAAIVAITANQIEDEVVCKKFILEQYEIVKKSRTFLNTDLSSEAKVSFARIESNIEEYITKIKNRHRLSLVTRLSILSNNFEENDSEKLADIVPFEVSLTELEAEYFDDYYDVKSVSNNFKEKVQSEIKRIKDEVLAKTYIIDTNVFIKEPDIISKIDAKHYIALSLSVIEELDKLKMIPENKVNASKAIRNINSVLTITKNSKRSRVRKQGADLTLLPVELQRKTADNLILSLGLVHKKNNPILLTLDRNFQSKAMMLDIPLITIYELLGINEEIKIKPKSRVKSEAGLDYKGIFKQMKPNKKGEYHIKAFIDEIKKMHPDFDFKKLGFDSEFKFVTSLRIFQVTDFKFLKLK